MKIETTHLRDYCDDSSDTAYPKQMTIINGHVYQLSYYHETSIINGSIIAVIFDKHLSSARVITDINTLDMYRIVVDKQRYHFNKQLDMLIMQVSDSDSTAQLNNSILINAFKSSHGSSNNEYQNFICGAVPLALILQQTKQAWHVATDYYSYHAVTVYQVDLPLFNNNFMRNYGHDIANATFRAAILGGYEDTYYYDLDSHFTTSNAHLSHSSMYNEMRSAVVLLFVSTETSSVTQTKKQLLNDAYVKEHLSQM